MPAVFGFAGTIITVLVVNRGWNVWLGSLAAILCATAVGAVNAFLVVKMQVNTIVVTLGMSTLLLGISLLISNDNTVSSVPASFQSIATKDVGGLPISFYYGVVLVLVFAYILACTPLGGTCGLAARAARLAGSPGYGWTGSGSARSSSPA